MGLDRKAKNAYDRKYYSTHKEVFRARERMNQGKPWKQFCIYRKNAKAWDDFK